MKKGHQIDSLRIQMMGWASVLAPVAVFLGMLHGPGLSWAELRRDREEVLSDLRENVYRKDGLDSLQSSLFREKEFLASLEMRVVRRLIPASVSVATFADSLRREAQALDCEVLRLSPSRDSSGTLRRLRLRLEARADFVPMMRWFRALRQNHPAAYVEEALIRPGGSGRLAVNLTLVFHMEEKP